MDRTAALRTWRIILLVTFILVPVANYLPIVLDVSQDRFTNGTDTRVDAAGYAFAIWGVIFTGMLLFAALQFRAVKESDHLLRALRYLCLAGWASIAFVPISFGANYFLGAADLLWHLAALVPAYLALRAHVAETGAPRNSWTYFAPSLYLGWICAATVIALALALQQAGLRVSDAVAKDLAAALVVVLALLGAFLGLRRDAFYALTVAWALGGIAAEQQDSRLILWTCAVGILALLGVVLKDLVGRRPFFYAWADR